MSGNGSLVAIKEEPRSLSSTLSPTHPFTDNINHANSSCETASNKMVSIVKIALIALAISFSASAYSLPTEVPRSVRDLVKSVHQFRASIDMQLDAAEQRLQLLSREMNRQKSRKRLLGSSLRASLLDSDLRFDESRAACDAVRNYNRSVIECNRLPEVQERVENLTAVCNDANDPGTCFEESLVGFKVLMMIFEFRCEQVEKQEMTISTTMMVCDELRNRAQDRMRVNSSNNPVVLETRGVLIGIDALKREISMLKEQIEAFTPITTMTPAPEPTPTPEPEVTPWSVDI